MQHIGQFTNPRKSLKTKHFTFLFDLYPGQSYRDHDEYFLIYKYTYQKSLSLAATAGQ